MDHPQLPWIWVSKRICALGVCWMSLVGDDSFCRVRKANIMRLQPLAIHGPNIQK